MNTELHFLHALLTVAIVVAPLVTSRFFLEKTTLHDVGHVVAGLLAVVALFADIPVLTFGWLLFCAASFALFVRERFARLSAAAELAKCVPFTFSIIGATWLFCGANDLGLLGYGEVFSYYAALHSTVLGWITVGGIAALANVPGRFQRFFIAAVYVSLVSFLLVAFGIDGVPHIKPVGVTGISLAVGGSFVLFVVQSWKTSRTAFALALVTLIGFLFTMTLAWQNELGMAIAPAFGTRALVSLHGVVNAFVVAPSFVLAVYMSSDRSASAPMSTDMSAPALPSNPQ